MKDGHSNFTRIGLATRTGYSLRGYWDDEDAQGDRAYTDQGLASYGKYWVGTGESAKFKGIDDTDQLYVYAAWMPNTYRVLFDKQGGAGGTDELVVAYDLAPNTIETPVKPGYTFNGYYDENPDELQRRRWFLPSGVPTRKWGITEDTTLIAQWYGNIHTLTFNANGGTVEPPQKTIQYNEAVGVLPIPKLVGKKFKGWYTAIDGGDLVNSSYVLEMDEDMKVHAKWGVNKYTVSFVNQEDIGPENSIEVEYGQPMPDVQVPERLGYEFAGYFMQENGYGTQTHMEDGTGCANWNIDDDGTVYANWIAHGYSIRFNANGGHGTMDD